MNDISSVSGFFVCFMNELSEILLAWKKVNLSALQMIHFHLKRAEMLFRGGPLVRWLAISENHMLGLDLEQSPSGTWLCGHLRHNSPAVVLSSIRKGPLLSIGRPHHQPARVGSGHAVAGSSQHPQAVLAYTNHRPLLGSRFPKAKMKTYVQASP